MMGLVIVDMRTASSWVGRIRGKRETAPDRRSYHFRDPNPAMRIFRIVRFVAVASGLLTSSATAQVLDLTIRDYGIAIGDKAHMTGLRINYRDRDLREINGVNLTFWSPYEPPTGVVNGLALGLPVTGARTVNGALVGVLGGGVSGSLNGVGIGGLGIGAGGDANGVMVGLLGVGVGGRMNGISIGGVGMGSGGSIRGIQVGGIGIGSGGDLTGISLGLVGVGAAGKVSGLAIGGIGVGGGSGFEGVGVGGIGLGSGGNMTGLMVGGVGVGSGGRIRGLSLAVGGVGAVELQGIAVSGLGAGAKYAHAIILTPGYFKIEDDGRFDGGAIGGITNVRGAQHGLTIGLFNYARELHGAQIGLINVSENDGNRRVLPLLSVR
jgi:hypothetical protein